MTKDTENIIRLLETARSIDLSKYNESFLAKSFENRMKAIGTLSGKDYCALLAQDSGEADRLLESLNIRYSEFFRGPLTFAVMERIVLPDLIQKCAGGNRNEIRIWSAACSGGQEPYSMAILLEELRGGSDRFKYRIFATDCSESRLQEARRGHYLPSVLNNVSLKRLNQWFDRQGDLYAVNPGLKANIDFSLFDLCLETPACPPASIFGDFDIIFCANVLLYYNTDHCKTMLFRTRECLADGGYIVTGESERGIITNYHYREAFPQSAIFRL
jgi:chemotaxis protein methyltransferase CheR